LTAIEEHVVSGITIEVVRSRTPIVADVILIEEVTAGVDA
jgi:hypothetical protein